MTSSTYNIKRIELELTSTCNLDCPLCMRSIHPELITKLKYRSKDEILNQIKSYKNLKYVTLAGPISEPTLHPEFFEILSELKKLNLEISLFINGNTHNDAFYRKLGLIFKDAIGHVYFTIAGSTQELHEKYRVNSNLENVIRRFKIVDKWSNKAILTWLVFNYNKDDFDENYKLFEDYNTEYFYTLPVQEHFNLDIDIHLPEPQHSVYKRINRNDANINCPALNYGFEMVYHDGSTALCTLNKLYGDKHCFECSVNNADLLRRNKIYHVSEPEDETSEIELRI